MNMDLDQTGSMLTCYRGKTTFANWKKGNAHLEFNHSSIKQIRKDLFNGTPNSNCAVCQNREQKGLHSIRYNFTKDSLDSGMFDKLVADIKQDPITVSLDNLLFVEVRAHNVCNLECMHCNQISSSRWTHTVKHNPTLKNFDVFAGHEDAVDNNSYISKNSPEDLAPLFANATNLAKVHFTGGEPLLDKTHQEWLDIVPNKQSINLGYHSNLQHKLYTKLFSTWNKFKSVLIYNSWDTCRRLYPYFRYGGQFDSMITNLDNIKTHTDNVELKGTLTVNLFSLFDFQDHIDMWTKYDMEPHHSFVEHTHPMSLAHLPSKLKKKLIADAFAQASHIENKNIKKSVSHMLQDILEFSSQHDDKTLNINTKNYISELDRIRKTNIKEICPELAEYFD